MRTLAAIVFLAGGAALLVGAALAPPAGLAAAATRMISDTWMDTPPLPQDLEELAVRSTIVDRDGNPITTISDQNRILAEADQIPSHVREAVIATEDRSFREHNGVDWQAVVRAAVGNVTAGEVTSGASTITQQLVKNVVITDPGEIAAQSIERKVTEAVYAVELEERLSKRQIMTQYLNTAYFANGVYGVATAAQHYWGTGVENLTVAQGALLAGMLRAPEANDPVDEPEAARQRRNIVLEQMVQVGSLSETRGARLKAQPLDLDVQQQERSRSREPFVDYVIHTITGVSGEPRLPGLDELGDTREERLHQLATGGYTVRTTLDSELHARAQGAIREHMAPQQPGHAALTVVDPRTGELLALGFGPREYGSEGADFHTGVPGLGTEGRQTGSAFKAFGIVAALEDGVPPSYTAQPSVPYRGSDHCSGYTVSNYAGGSGGTLDMYEATARSSNVYFVHLMDQMTSPGTLQSVAQRMGVPDVDSHCSSVLGTDEVYGVDMASGLGTLANGGEHCDPFAITEIVDRHGEVVYEGDGECEQVLDRDTAARATDILRGPIQGGTATRARIGRPAAGKTGTTDEYGNAWFVGFVPQLSASVWTGRENPDRFSHPACGPVTGGCLPAAVWATFMRDAVDVLGLSPEGFPSPPPLPTTAVPDVTGVPQQEAVATLDEAGFSASVEEVEHHARPGTVLTQTPRGGTQAPARSVVELEVSDGSGEPPTMPFLVTLSREEAMSILESLHVDVRVVQVPVEDSEEIGNVVGQSPEHGTELGRDQTIRLEVGREGDPEPGSSDQPSPGPGSGSSTVPELPDDGDGDGDDDEGGDDADGDDADGDTTDDGDGGEGQGSGDGASGDGGSGEDGSGEDGSDTGGTGGSDGSGGSGDEGSGDEGSGTGGSGAGGSGTGGSGASGGSAGSDDGGIL